MKLDVKNLINVPVGDTEVHSIKLTGEKIDDDVTAGKIDGELKLTRLENEILAQFNGEASLIVPCDRCAKEFTLNLPLKFNQEYTLDRSAANDEILTVSSRFEIDFSEPMRQEVLAAIPVKKLCQENCAGLCIHCGANLNDDKCSCIK